MHALPVKRMRIGSSSSGRRFGGCGASPRWTQISSGTLGQCPALVELFDIALEEIRPLTLNLENRAPTSDRRMQVLNGGQPVVDANDLRQHKSGRLDPDREVL